MTKWRVIDKSGKPHGPFDTWGAALDYIEAHWPNQQQDERRTGKGWDIEAVREPQGTR